MLTVARLGRGSWALVLSALASTAASSQVSAQTPTPLPRLSGGFGRPRTTAVTPAAPSPDAGGFIPGESVSFDTKGYDWNAYGAEMVRRIKLHWDIPELAQLGWTGSLTVRFYIMSNGTVADAKIARSSGIQPFDEAALQAIVKSSPFRPLPVGLREDREGVTVTFFYNMRPESKERGAEPPIRTPHAATQTTRALMLPSLNESIAAAARGTVGSAQVGRLSLDQANFQYPVYIQRVVGVISINWFKPAQEVQTSPVVHFQIERDGTITGARIVTSSGVAFVDRAALRAVVASSPLPPLPADYDGQHLGIQVVFE